MIKGRNVLNKAVFKGKVIVEDEISFEYQTNKWEKPSLIEIMTIKTDDKTVEVEAYLVDKNGIKCLEQMITSTLA